MVNIKKSIIMLLTVFALFTSSIVANAEASSDVTCNELKDKHIVDKKGELISGNKETGSFESSTLNSLSEDKTILVDMTQDNLYYLLKFDVHLNFIGESFEDSIVNYCMDFDLGDSLDYSKIKINISEDYVSARFQSGKLIVSVDPSKFDGEGDLNDVELGFNYEIDKKKVASEYPYSVLIPFNNEKSYSINFIPDYKLSGEDSKVGKLGTLVNSQFTETSIDPTHAVWEVTINDAMDVIKDAVFKDTFTSKNHILNSLNDIYVYKLDRNRDGSLKSDNQILVDGLSKKYGSDQYSFEIDLGTIDETYVIKYITRLDGGVPGSMSQFSNVAQLLGNNHNTNITMDNPLIATWTEVYPDVTKTGKFNGNMIEWIVSYNYEGKNLGNLILTDTLSHGEYIKDSLKVYEVSIVNGVEIIGNQINNITVSYPTDNTMLLDVPNSNGKRLRLIYSTSVPGGLNTTISNTVEDQSDETPKVIAEVPVNTIPHSTKVAQQLVDENGIPYVKWTVKINTTNQMLGNFTVRDSFDENYLILKQPINIFKLDKGDRLPIKDLDTVQITDFENIEGKSGFDVKINQVGNHTYEIEYSTYYTDAGLMSDKLVNSINVDFIFDYPVGDGTGNPSNVVSNQVETEIHGPLPGVKKTGIYSYDVSTESIKWRIEFNQAKLNLNKPTITDVMSSDKMSLYPNSQIVVKDVTGKKLQLNIDYTLDYIGSFDKFGGYTLNFLSELPGSLAPYSIEYTTLIPKDFNENIQNKATFDWQGRPQNSEANLSKRQPNLVKKGNFNSEYRVIEGEQVAIHDWTLKFNENKVVVYDVVIEDTISNPIAQIISPNEMKLMINRNGVTEEVDNSLYTIDITANGFILKVDRLEPYAYSLSYKTMYPRELETEDLTNKATIKFAGNQNGLTSQDTIKKPGFEIVKLNSKVSMLDESKGHINWRVGINTMKSNLKDAFVFDSITSDQVLLVNSVNLFKGNSALGTQIVLDESNAIINDDYLEIQLDDGAYEYFLTYTTKVITYPSLALSNTYSNMITLQDALGRNASSTGLANVYEPGKQGNIPSKSGIQNEDDETVSWEAVVNQDSLPLKDAYIYDQLDGKQKYVANSIAVYVLGQNDTYSQLPQDNYVLLDSSGTTQFDPTTHEGFVIKMNNFDLGDGIKETLNGISNTYKIMYRTYVKDEYQYFVGISNKIALRGNTLDSLKLETTSRMVVEKFSSYGSASLASASFNISKTANDLDRTPIQGITFILERIGSRGTTLSTHQMVTNEQGKVSAGKIRSGKYLLYEMAYPGFKTIEKHNPIKLTVVLDRNGNTVISFDTQSWSSSASVISDNKITKDGSSTLEISNQRIYKNVTATKQWEFKDSPIVNAMLPEVYFKLQRSTDESIEVLDELKSLNRWGDKTSQSIVFENLPVADFKGNIYEYKVLETDKNGNSWTQTGFESIQVDPLTVKNSNVDDATVVSLDISKSWKNDGRIANYVRPETITVKIIADDFNKPYRTVTLKASENWQTTINDLPAYDKYGNRMNYKIVEDTPLGYNSSGQVSVQVNDDNTINPVIITNTYNNTTQTHTFRKQWIYNTIASVPQAAVGVLYPEVQINLYRIINNDVTTEELVTSKVFELSKDYSFVFTNLEKYNLEERTLYTYYVKESKVGDVNTPWTHPSFSSQIVDSNTINNTYTNAVVSLDIVKVWNDSNNLFETRPEAIFFDIINSVTGQVIQTNVRVDSTNNWTLTVNNLPKFDIKGREVAYDIKEKSVSGYTQSNVEISSNLIDGIISSSFTNTVINKKVSVVKIWDDSNNQDGIRPKSINFDFIVGYVNDAGNHITKEIGVYSLSDANNWTLEIADLPLKNSRGHDLYYTVIEHDILDENTNKIYGEVAVDVRDSVIKITNSHKPQVIDIKVVKEWMDDNNRDNLRTKSIHVELFANGKPTGLDATLSHNDAWAYTFEDMPVFENGKRIVYTIEEKAVAQYQSEITGSQETGFVIINKHESELISVSVVKEWMDDNNRDGKRPTDLIVRLFANGVSTGKLLELNEENAWSARFEDLYKYESGVEIVYTVEENTVADYSSQLSGDQYSGYHFINRYVPQRKSISVQKIWSDGYDKFNLRPESIEVYLYANGINTGISLTFSESDEWQRTFENLYIYKNGVKIDYSIKEEPIKYYNSSIVGSDEIGFELTNTIEIDLVASITEPLPNTGVVKSPLQQYSILTTLLGIMLIVLNMGVKRKEEVSR